MINRLLVANRGEIARRVFATCRRLGIETVAVHSDADAGEPFVTFADRAVRLPGTSSAQTYLDGERVIAAAVAAGARVKRALEILGTDIPEHLRYAGELRLKFKDASLDELGHHANPPMTKDAVAGRIRRLLAMADKKAEELGIPATDADLPEDLED